MRDLKEGRLELDLDLVHEANGLLERAEEVLGDDWKRAAEVVLD